MVLSRTAFFSFFLLPTSLRSPGRRKKKKSGWVLRLHRPASGRGQTNKIVLIRFCRSKRLLFRNSGPVRSNRQPNQKKQDFSLSASLSSTAFSFLPLPRPLSRFLVGFALVWSGRGGRPFGRGKSAGVRLACPIPTLQVRHVGRSANRFPFPLRLNVLTKIRFGTKSPVP